MAPKKSSPVAAVAVTAPAPPPVVVPEPAPAAVDENMDRFATILSKLQSWQSDIKEAILTIKALQMEHNKL